MLKTPAPFPQVGSYALHEAAGQTRLARIQRIDPDDPRIAMISHPGSFHASGNVRVAIADLKDGTPLTAAEIGEWAVLEQKLAGLARPRKVDLARELALRSRSIHADVLRDKLRAAGLLDAVSEAA